MNQLRASLITHRPKSLEYVVSHILPHIKAKCPNTQAPWVLLGMKKDMRTNEKKRARHERLGKSFASPERAKEIGEKHGAALVMECSSLEEAACSWTLHNLVTCIHSACLSVCLYVCTSPSFHAPVRLLPLSVLY